MISKKVTVPWREGLHARPAARLVKRALGFQSSILLKVNEKFADARSILGVILLCASAGSVVDLEVTGVDEDAALASMVSFFESSEMEQSEETFDLAGLRKAKNERNS